MTINVTSDLLAKKEAAHQNAGAALVICNIDGSGHGETGHGHRTENQERDFVHLLLPLAPTQTTGLISTQED